MPADIRIFRSQLSIRRQGKCRRIPATGNGRRAQIFQERLIHDYLVALHDESGRLVSVCRVNISNAIRRHQELAYLPVRRVFHAQSKSGHIIFAVFGLLYFDAPHGVPFIVSILPLLRKLLQFAGVNGVLGYEAQLVNAVIASSSAIHGRFHYRYGGDWERCTRTQEITRDKNGKNGKYTVTERVRGWTDEDEIGLFVQVGAILRGESEITWGEPLYLSGVVTRNSPLWVSNPKQQIAYLGVKYWARLYCPEVILGVYSPDEVEQREEREINPAPVQRMSVQEITSEVSTRTSAQESAANVDAVADDLRERIDTASSVDQAKAIRADIESQKALLGTALFTELKNKAVKRYYQVDAQNKVEAVINSIPNPGEPEAAEMFAKAESTLGAAKRHLGDELHDKYRVTLDDMKPEYIG